MNVHEPDAAIVTGIALDHTDWFGPDRESIGSEKAGIFRAGRPAICADPQPPQSLLDHAAAIGADLQLIGRDFGHFGDKTQWTWWGSQQSPSWWPGESRHPWCAAAGQRPAALAALDALKTKLPVDMQSVRRGLIEIELAGRFQLVPGKPAIVPDVAHNPQAVGVLASNLGDMGFYANTHAVVGMLADKDVAGALATLKAGWRTGTSRAWMCRVGPCRGAGGNRGRSGRYGYRVRRCRVSLRCSTESSRRR